MKINFTDYDLTDFIVKEGLFLGKEAKLITPNITAKWTKDNLIFRSSIWDLDGNLLSASFRKFPNLNENPEVFPIPASLEDTSIVTKIDGSTFIVDAIGYDVNVRTRGVFTFRSQDNADDFSYVLIKYPKIIEWILRNKEATLLLELMSPNQRIVLDPGDKPDLHLIGCISKNDYWLFPQWALDLIAEQIGVRRPEYHNCNNLDELVSYIKPRKDIEGVCIYSKGDQKIHKVKTDYYLKLHRAKSDIGSFPKVVDIFLESNTSTFDDFFKFVETNLDYELAKMASKDMAEIIEINERSAKIISEIKSVVEVLKPGPRKDAALRILELYQKDGLSSFAFNLLNGKEIEKKHLKELILKLRK